MIMNNEEGLQTVSVRMPKELYKKLVSVAKKETRSISQQIIHYIKQSFPELGEELMTMKKVTDPSADYKPPPNKEKEGDAEKHANG